MEMDNPLDGAKAVENSRIRDAFLDAPKYGLVIAAGFKMDSKREDIDNLTRLRDRLIETGTATTTIRDFDNQYHNVTVAELSTIVGELVDFGLSLYTRKWTCESAIDSAATSADLEAVTW